VSLLIDKKYELLEDNIKFIENIKLYRIRALCDFGTVIKGDIGGYVETEDNLSHMGDCWIYDDAHVIGKAKVYENAKVCSDAWICNYAEVFGNALVAGGAHVYDRAKIYGNARVYDQARVYNSSKVFGNAEVHGNSRIKSRTKVSKKVTVIDNNDVVITITDDEVLVYQCSLYKKNNLPNKYKSILELLNSIERNDDIQ